MAVVAAPILFYLNPSYVPAPMILATLSNCAMMAWLYRSHLSLRGLWPAIIWRVPGSIVGAALLLVVSTKLLAIFISLVILLALASTYLRTPFLVNRRNLGIAGFLSGVMGTSTSIGGPPMAILMQSQAANSIRSHLAAFFIFSCLISLIIYLPMGYLGWQEIRLAIPLLLGSVFGTWLGYRFSSHIKERPMRIGTLCLCVFAIVAMLVRQFR